MIIYLFPLYQTRKKRRNNVPITFCIHLKKITSPNKRSLSEHTESSKRMNSLRIGEYKDPPYIIPRKLSLISNEMCKIQALTCKRRKPLQGSIEEGRPCRILARIACRDPDDTYRSHHRCSTSKRDPINHQ